jgi:hypothetical protein
MGFGNLRGWLGPLPLHAGIRLYGVWQLAWMVRPVASPGLCKGITSSSDARVNKKAHKPGPAARGVEHLPYGIGSGRANEADKLVGQAFDAAVRSTKSEAIWIAI